MKLSKVHVREFKSIWDSNAFEIGKVTCLIGKNEAGKTAILQALYRLNPIVDDEGHFDVTDDYPRSEVEDYQQDVENGQRTHAVVVEATFELEATELEAIQDEYGADVLEKPEVVVSRGYETHDSGKCRLFVRAPVDEIALTRNLIERYDLPGDVAKAARKKSTVAQLLQYLTESGQQKGAAVAKARAAADAIEEEVEKATAQEKCKSLAESEQAIVLRAKLTELSKLNTFGIWRKILSPNFPKFLYFDEYYQMRGHDNVEALKERKDGNELKRSDHPLLGLIELARLDLDELLSPSRTAELKNKLQGASNHLSKRILKYWSQNKHLRMQFDVRPGLAGDPEGMTTGTNIWGDVFDSNHEVSTPLGTRSAGFVWFFSFLAWYSSVKKKKQPLVLLLDEPGLSLHGKAQEDLLRYFEEEIVTNPKHQLVYTTHSPFMVDSQHRDRVRIVQDKGIDAEGKLAREEDGTKVFTEVLDATPDSLFPLQGALGYEIYQNLFIGPNSLVVEGVSDLLYIETISSLLQAKGEAGLSSDWTITPVGGSDKVATFVALIGAQKHLNIAVLIDYQKKDQQSIENLYTRKLLEKKQILTYADFVAGNEADIEDMFNAGFYLKLVDGEFGSNMSVGDLPKGPPRILVRLEQHLAKNPLPNEAKFNHYRPARYFAEKIATLSSELTESQLDRFRQAFAAVNALL